MSDDKQPADGPPPEKRSRFQFTLATMFLVISLSCVLFWALGGMIQHSGEGDTSKAQFVLITLMAPVGLVLLLAALNAILRVFRRPRKKRRDRW